MAGQSSVTTSLLGPLTMKDPPAVGMCFLEKAHGVMFVRTHSARSGPYRVQPGGGKATTVWLCNCRQRSAFPNRVAHKANPASVR